MKKILLITLFIILYCAFARWAFSAVSEDEAVRCIMGEARGESYKGKLAVAEVIRRRGSTAGFYGCSAKFKEKKKVWDAARRAWRESARTRVSKGANMFENVKAFGWPRGWDRKEIKFVTKIENHEFFKKEEK